MIEVCPRCYSRLGAPLRSGRQVCADCGWASEPLASKPALTRPKRSPLVEILHLCWRIVRRTVTYTIKLVQDRFQGARQASANAGPIGKGLVEGLSDRLSALEKAIPTDVTDSPRWMSLEEAFKYLGGDLRDPESVVSTTNQSTSLPFRRFRILKAESEFRAFGLIADLSRRDDHKPWLRWSDEA